jgi:hypothetical protein
MSPVNTMSHSVAFDHVAAVDGVHAEPSAHLDDNHALLAEFDFELLAGRIGHR